MRDHCARICTTCSVLTIRPRVLVLLCGKRVLVLLCGKRSLRIPALVALNWCDVRSYLEREIGNFPAPTRVTTRRDRVSVWQCGVAGYQARANELGAARAPLRQLVPEAVLRQLPCETYSGTMLPCLMVCSQSSGLRQ